MKKRRTMEEDGDPSSIRHLSKMKMQKLNAPEGEEESKAINPEPKAEKDNKVTKNKKEKVKNMERDMEEEKDSYLPGQRHDTPHERDPFRIFLETLYQRIPANELAASWMIEWGLLSSDEAKKKVCNKIPEKNLHGQPESANSDAADARTSTLSVGNLDVVYGTVSKAKKQKVHKTSSDDAISDLHSRKKKRKKKKTKGFH